MNSRVNVDYKLKMRGEVSHTRLLIDLKVDIIQHRGCERF